MKRDKTTLKDAQKSGKLDKFIAEREDTPPGNMGKFNACLTSMAETPKPKPGTSKRGKRGG